MYGVFLQNLYVLHMEMMSTNKSVINKYWPLPCLPRRRGVYLHVNALTNRAAAFFRRLLPSPPDFRYSCQNYISSFHSPQITIGRVVWHARVSASLPYIMISSPSQKTPEEICSFCVTPIERFSETYKATSDS